MSDLNLLSEAITNTFLSLMEDMHTCIPGVIVNYDYKLAKASVKPLLQRAYIDDETLVMPVLHEVPVIFPRTQSAGITFPINVREILLLTT